MFLIKAVTMILSFNTGEMQVKKQGQFLCGGREGDMLGAIGKWNNK